MIDKMKRGVFSKFRFLISYREFNGKTGLGDGFLKGFQKIRVKKLKILDSNMVCIYLQ